MDDVDLVVRPVAVLDPGLGDPPDAARHEHTLAALRALILDDAALQRDVLKARIGLLRNYDPLVRSVENLHRAVGSLRSDGQAADGNLRDAFDRHVENVAAAATDQENLVESFKSRNALLQNSLMFLDHTIRQFDSGGSRQQDAVSTEVGILANAMLRFMSNPRGEVANDLTASLERLAQLPAGNANPDVRALVSHGHLIAATLPAVDQFVSRILAAATTEQTRALQDDYLEAGVILCQQSPDAGLDIPLLVPRRDQHAHQRDIRVPGPGSGGAVVAVVPADERQDQQQRGQDRALVEEHQRAAPCRAAGP